MATSTSTSAKADDTAATGAAAALGLTAASGKTTMASGAGVGEAALLTSEMLGKTGALIATIARTQVAKNPIFVLTHEQQIDLSAPRFVSGRIAKLQQLLNADGCKAAAPALGVVDDSGGGAVKVKPADVGAALATDTTIASIPLTVDDRVLITAIAMSARLDGAYTPLQWRSDETAAATLVKAANDTAPPAIGTKAAFLVPGDMLVVPANSTVMASFQTLLATATKQRSCAKDAKVKGILDDVDAFANTVTTPPDKGGSSQLGLAAELEASATGKADILRVAVEQAGGTAITRSNIWYTLGFPGAAVVSASLIASFRLTDGGSGRILVAGFVRCAVAPVRVTGVAESLSSSKPVPGVKKTEVSCSYLI